MPAQDIDDNCSNMADFLGDPSFPDKAMRVKSRALKIEYFQGLYKQYSRLAFTRDFDRRIAIAGLEKRLLTAFGTRGRYGIFGDSEKAESGLFHRSLLWQRNLDDGMLHSINFPVELRDTSPAGHGWHTREASTTVTRHAGALSRKSRRLSHPGPMAPMTRTLPTKM